MDFVNNDEAYLRSQPALRFTGKNIPLLGRAYNYLFNSQKNVSILKSVLPNNPRIKP